VAVVRSRLQLETGTAPEMQILLARFGGEAGAPVRELHARVRGQAATLADHRVAVPLGKGLRVCVFDKAFMQPGGVAPMERLNRFELEGVEGLRGALGALQRRCELQRTQLGEQMARQAHRAEASRVAVDFLRAKSEAFRAAVAEFEGKWKVMALHHPALIASASDDLERLQSTRVRPELGLKVGRTLWDLYTQNSGQEMLLFVRKSEQEHEALAGKIKRCLEACKNVLRDAGELAARPYEPLEPLESAHQRLMKLTQVTVPFLERKLVQEGEGSVAVARGLQQAEQEHVQAVNEAETFINNYTLSIQLRLQGVTTLSQGVWQQQEQIKGVLGIALDRLMQRFHALLIVHELPALQNAIADEAVKRAQFRERAAATFRGLEAALEPFLVDETNRRAGFLSDKHAFVREFVASRFEWLRDEPMSLGLPQVPAFGRKLPVAASPPSGSLPLIEIGSCPFPPSPTSMPPVTSPPLRKDKEEAEVDGNVRGNGNSNNNSNNDKKSNNGSNRDDLINEYTERIAYLERVLRERVERSTLDVQRLRLETKQQEQRLLDENSVLKGELNDGADAFAVPQRRQERGLAGAARGNDAVRGRSGASTACSACRCRCGLSSRVSPSCAQRGGAVRLCSRRPGGLCFQSADQIL
jgi:hypothetical protein